MKPHVRSISVVAQSICSLAYQILSRFEHATFAGLPSCRIPVPRIGNVEQIFTSCCGGASVITMTSILYASFVINCAVVEVVDDRASMTGSHTLALPIAPPAHMGHHGDTGQKMSPRQPEPGDEEAGAP